MGADFAPKETDSHQDHVIAHVVGTTVLGYLVFDETLFVLLDIGFVWSVFLDGQMGLLPHPVAVKELVIDDATRTRIKSDIEVLLAGIEADLLEMKRPPVSCLIESVSFFAAEESRRLLIGGEPGSLVIETSLVRGTISLSEY